MKVQNIENAKFWIASDGKVDQIGVEKDFKGRSLTVFMIEKEVRPGDYKSY